MRRWAIYMGNLLRLIIIDVGGFHSREEHWPRDRVRCAWYIYVCTCTCTYVRVCNCTLVYTGVQQVRECDAYLNERRPSRAVVAGSLLIHV